MCGIWGRISVSKRAKLDDLVHPVRMLAHRGPDGYGILLEEASAASVAFVHTRLSIIDLEGGTQPLKSFDGRYVGVVNGELYDYHGHRERLQAKGVTFKTQSDSEVLLNIFAEEGPLSLGRISGEFAFIFFDRKEQRFYFGRDLHGVKPLFFNLEGDTLTLASEVKALKNGKPEIDEAYLKRFVSGIVVPPRTAIQGAFHVLPGRVYSFDPKTEKFDYQAFLRPPLNRERKLKGQEAIERVRFELEHAVKRRTVADVEVGTYLSGGIDSALVAAYMVKVGMKPKAFTVGFPEAKFDETDRAAAIARHLGIEHHVVQLSGANFFEHFKRSVVAFENPVGNVHGAAKNLLSKLAGAHVKVVLTGEGADEWLGGYAYFRIQKLRKFAETHPRLARGAIDSLIKKQKGVGQGHLDGARTSAHSLIGKHFKGYVPASFGRVVLKKPIRSTTQEKYEEFLNLAFSELAAYMAEDLPLGRNGALSEMDLNVWTSLRTDLLHYLLGNLGDRQEMSHSLEGRTPFLDARLAECAGELHPNMMIRGLTEKYVIRALAKDLLPAEITRTKKHPFFAPSQYLAAPAVREEVEHAIGVAREATPWLPWKSLNVLLLGQKVWPSLFLRRDLGFRVRILLFSVGVLVEQLHRPQLERPRGYRLPETGKDLESHVVRL